MACLRSLVAVGLLAAAALTALPAAAAAADPASAVILMYHRFGQDRLPSTSIRIDQFEHHIERLTSGSHTVLPLEEVALALVEGRPLPDRTVAITIDDTDRSIVTEALPRLKAAGLPFTVFVSTDAVGQVGGALTWDDIRLLEAGGAAIGAHGAAHDHMAFMTRAAMEEDLVRMAATFLQELGEVPRLFAYPYGEYGVELVSMVRDAGYIAAFGQHSGVATAGANRFTLPRFAMNERYGAADRFATVIDTLPLPATGIVPQDMPIATGQPNPPAVGFTALESAGPLHRLACFASNGAEVTLGMIGARRVELRLDRPFPPGRSRINCTIPAGDSRFRWLGIPFVVPGGAG
ncbi:MAG: polysaccharide deacetylase family protein [Rhodospirillales bacterium]|nr:polysaccharide deacetylase family protein [Rhodospirillales bacterium]